jgi:hypothetical protein
MWQFGTLMLKGDITTTMVDAATTNVTSMTSMTATAMTGSGIGKECTFGN